MHRTFVEQKLGMLQCRVCIDRDAGLPSDAALWHVLHRCRYLRLLLDAAGS